MSAANRMPLLAVERSALRPLGASWALMADRPLPPSVHPCEGFEVLDESSWREGAVLAISSLVRFGSIARVRGLWWMVVVSEGSKRAGDGTVRAVLEAFGLPPATAERACDRWPETYRAFLAPVDPPTAPSSTAGTFEHLDARLAELVRGSSLTPELRPLRVQWGALTSADMGALAARGQLRAGTDVVLTAGTPHQCHANSSRLMRRTPGSTWWSGLALAEGGREWSTHSWVIDASGRLLETTFARVQYFGLPFLELPSFRKFGARPAGLTPGLSALSTLFGGVP